MGNPPSKFIVHSHYAPTSFHSQSVPTIAQLLSRSSSRTRSHPAARSWLGPRQLRKYTLQQGNSVSSQRKYGTHKDMDGILRFDILNDKQVDLKLFMSTVLHISDSPPSAEVEVLDEIMKSPEFFTLLEGYSKPIVREEERYPRFTELCRHAIGQMVDKKITKNKLGFTLCVNDPEYIRGSEADRKPDTVGTTMKAIETRIQESKNAKVEAIKARLRESENVKVEGKKKANVKTVKTDWTPGSASTPTLEEIIEMIMSPPETPLMWSDLFMFAEFKVNNKDYQQNIKGSGASQQVRGSAPTSSVIRQSDRSISQTMDLQLTKASYSPIGDGDSQSYATSRGGSTGGRRSLNDSGVGASGASSCVRSSSSKRRRGDDEPAQGVGRPTKRPKVISVEILLQCAGYAQLMFNRGGVRTHVIGVLITNNVLELLLYTRSGGCFSDTLDFVESPNVLLQILLAFSRLTRSQWGFFDKLIPTTQSLPRYPVVHRKIDASMFKGKMLDAGDHRFEVADIRVFPRGLIGRGTYTIRMQAKSKELLGEGKVRKLILKISSAPTTRKPEQFFLDKASTAANEDTKEKWVLNHLPDMVDSGDFEGTVSFEHLFGEDYEKRTLRYLAVEELYLITDLTAPEELRLAFKNIVYCHQWLVTVPGIMHRDVSINNLMFRVKGDRKFGVLNDFDLACTLDEDRQSSSKQRTGTKPFIARDLLTLAKESDTLQKHFVWYDLELMVYVFAWIICCYEDGREIQNPPFEGWCKGNLVDVRRQKSDWMHRSVEHQPITPQYESLRRILESLRTQLRHGYNARDEYLAPDFPSGLPPFKHETLGDHVTYSTILAALDPPPPYTDALAALS
ncbi:hypothetical protein E1B28_005106 [Marasmius oreades]|uniref:Protein kinase domain-containing protein n=1 Tax=Marasmius oreades TaxID=181124 RepID=A0A9P7V028_9AGAR|nr:uncharacterized protein E1B28_005106 [Marasmius oreades]KAG7097787.1 hypothetical protein E1B28_005106 [Marasmius oreades]